MFDRDALDTLVDLAERHVRFAGLPAAQLAVAWRGELILDVTIGAPDETLFTTYSVTKAFTSAAIWQLLEEGALDLDQRVAEVVPGFEAGGKGAVTIKHLLLHTSGFPSAHLDPVVWPDRERRLEIIRSWTVEHEPGARFEYHPTAGMWTLAEVLERVTGQDHRAAIHRRVIEPLGLSDAWLGVPPSEHHRIAPVEHVGAPSGYRAVDGLRPRRPEAFSEEEYVESYNTPGVRAVGVPSGGLVARAADVARFYQALLSGQAPDGRVLWSREMLREARTVHSSGLKDPMTGGLANRGLGLVIAGGDDRIYRGFGAECSPAAFGHPGLGGQIAWADPETGLSFAFFTSGIDRNNLRLGMRMMAISTAASRVVTGSKPRGGLISRWAQSTEREVERAHYQREPAFIEGLLPWMDRFSRYFDAEVRGMDRIPRGGPVLLVGNHSGGLLTPDTTAVIAAWYHERGLDDPLVGLAFDAAFAVPVLGSILRRIGFVPASWPNAGRALESGRSVLVYPGGAYEVFRPWGQRNRVDFGDHKGFVRLALTHGVPVVPVVGHGGHETLMVLARGQALGRALGLDRIRIGFLPLVLQAPWGISPPVPGLPLPAKVTMQVLDPLDWSGRSASDEAAVQACYDEITQAMQETLDDLAREHPRPLVERIKRLVGVAA